ncbi:MAG: hypothetical protein MJE77_37435 [Proteobacteria bacterium]|nr:hypothetical protein [Pseudomonadota bacterium]
MEIDGVTHTIDDPVPRDERYWVRLAGSVTAGLIVVGSSIWRWSGKAVQPVPCAPGVSPHQHVFRGRRIVAVHDDAAFTWQKGSWTRHSLPAGFTAVGADFDQSGALWVVGSVQSDRMPGCDTEAAIRKFRPGGWNSRALRLGPLATTRTINRGGMAQIRTIDAAGEPVIATSLCAWFVEDESSFLFTLRERKDRVTHLPNDVVRMVDRPAPGVARVWTVHGDLWTVDRRPVKRSLRGPLLKALGLGPRHLVVRAVAGRGDEVLLAVEVAIEGRTSEADDGEYTAICGSSDEGRSFALRRIDRVIDGPEWCGVAL